MSQRQPSRALAALTVSCAVSCALSCTNAQLYDPDDAPNQANKIAFTGRVCTDNPAERSFPLRIVFAIDSSSEPLTGVDDATQAALQTRRVDTLRDVVGSLRSRDTSYALIRYGGESLAQPTGTFTTNAVEMAEAAGSLTVPVPCTADGCRRTGQALSIASSLITGDLFSTPRGPRSRTKYVVVFMQNGPTDDVVLNGATTADCDISCVLQGRVAELRRAVLDGGGADLQVHTVDLATLDSNAGARNTTKLELQRMSFAGAGEYAPVCARNDGGQFVVPGCGPQNLSLAALEIDSARNVFLKKSFVVSNMNARTLPDGTVIPDSDGDGLSDEEEAIYGTNPAARDSDGDGIGDKVELLMQTTGLDPNVPDDPVTCAFLPPEERFVKDSDGDGLLDCEEALLRLDPTLFDTDGDGLPDPLEVFHGTNFLDNDGLEDADFDGATNLDELRAHTNPRAADAKTRSELSYFYREVDLGVRTSAFTSQPRTITGVVVEETGGLSSLGNAGLTFLRNNTRVLLAFRDANEQAVGNAVDVSAGGSIRLDAACIGIEPPCERFITVKVTPQLLPPVSRDELLRVTAAERQCTDFRVSNISLVETIPADGHAIGRNDIRIFFSQVPGDSTGAFPIFRVAQFPFTFLAPDVKDPNVADQFVDDFRFVLFE